MHLEERGTEEMSLCSSTVPQKLKEAGLRPTTLQYPSSTSGMYVYIILLLQIHQIHRVFILQILN